MPDKRGPHAGSGERGTRLPAPTTSATARSLISAAFPDLVIGTVRQFGEGWVNTVWVVNEHTDPVLFRFPKLAAATAATLMEMRLLPSLSAYLGLPVPDYRYSAPQGVPGFPHPFGGYPTIAGRPLAGIEGIADEAMGRAVADFIVDLQSFPPDEALALGVPGGSAADWRREYQDWYSATRMLIAGHLDAGELAAVDRVFGSFLGDDRNFRFSPVLVHRDLGPDHLLVDPATTTLTGVIDFEDAFIGDPAFDFTGVEPLWPDILTTRRGLQDETFVERIRFYQFIIPLHELQYGCETGAREHIRQGQRTLRANLRAQPVSR